MRLIELEAGYRTMPTAVFYAAEGEIHQKPRCEFGRAAVAAYVDGVDMPGRRITVDWGLDY